MLWIARDPHDPMQLWLGIDETPLRAHGSVEAAVNAVRTRETGWHPLDESHHLHRPQTLAEWQPGPGP